MIGTWAANSSLPQLAAWTARVKEAIAGVGTLAVNSVTPSVAGKRLWATANTSATNITLLREGRAGQHITIWFTDGNTTLVHGAALALVGGVDYTGAAGKTITLATLDGDNWRELPLR